MALSPVKTWVKETLTYQALNAEFLNIYNNPMSLISPATGNFDLDGQSLIIDADGDTSATGSTDDQWKITMGGSLVFIFDGTTASLVNGLKFVASSTTNAVQIQGYGSDTDIDIDVVPKGAGLLQVGGSVLTGPPIQGSTTWDPGSLDDGAKEAKDVTATGAALGDFVLVSFSLDLVDVTLTAAVTAADTVTCLLNNESGGTVDLGSGTVYVRVLPRA